MLVVISDLHFEEEESDAIIVVDGRSSIRFSRNVPAKAYSMVIADLATHARRDKAEKLDLVLAGDVFDLHLPSRQKHRSRFQSDDRRPGFRS